jgi:acetyl-CoA carboxylase biotin carboxyl carrier protein
MPSGELAQHPAMDDQSAAPPAGDSTTRALSEEIVELARALPGRLRRLTVTSGDRAIGVEWATEPDQPDRSAAAPARPAPEPADRPDPAEEVPAGTRAVRAPLVGTFYRAPSPGADPFVRVGDEVEAGDTLGIVEAMKLMNPIVADEPGIVAELVAGDTESVEYDQVLMLLRPAGRPQ